MRSGLIEQETYTDFSPCCEDLNEPFMDNCTRTAKQRCSRGLELIYIKPSASTWQDTQYSRSFGPTCLVFTIILHPNRGRSSSRQWAEPVGNHTCYLGNVYNLITRGEYLLTRGLSSDVDGFLSWDEAANEIYANYANSSELSRSTPPAANSSSWTCLGTKPSCEDECKRCV